MKRFVTARELIKKLESHPEWLDLPVHLLNDDDQCLLTLVEQDCFDETEGPVVSLIAEKVP